MGLNEQITKYKSQIPNCLRAPLNPLKGKNQRAFRTENQQHAGLSLSKYHYDERSEELICFKFLTDSFVALAMTFPIFRSQGQQPMAKNQQPNAIKQFNNKTMIHSPSNSSILNPNFMLRY
jgi:hypothetical protein